MTHKTTLKELDQNLDDLKVRNPRGYRGIEHDLDLLKIRSELALTSAPIGIRDMEKGK